MDAAQHSPTLPRPNFVVICVDQMRFDALVPGRPLLSEARWVRELTEAHHGR